MAANAPGETPRLPGRVSEALGPDLRDVLLAYASGLRGSLPRALIGVYLYGSVVHEDFVPRRSDVDVAVLHQSDLTPGQRRALAEMHEHPVHRRPPFSRLDVSYAPLRLAGAGGEDSLPYFRNGVYHRSGGGDVNVVLWRALRERGVAVWGRPPTEVVPPVSREDIDAEMRRNLAFLRRRMPAYAASGSEATVFGVLSPSAAFSTR